MNQGKKLKKAYLVAMAVSFIATACLTSECFSWMVIYNFSHGQIGKPAQGPSGFEEAAAQTLFADELTGIHPGTAKMIWSAGSDGGGTYGFSWLPSKLTEGGELWFKASLYFKSPWLWNCDPVVKVIRAHVGDAGGNHLGYNSVFWTGNKGEITMSNEITGNEPPLGVFFDKDKWQDIEMYLKFSATKPIFRIWKNGILLRDNRSDKTLNSPTDIVDAIYVMGYWNGGVPQDQVEYIADVVLTNETPPNRDAKGNPMISFPKPTTHSPPAQVKGLKGTRK